MFDHVTISVSDLEASIHFYRTVLERELGEFGAGASDDEHPVTRHLHVAFAAPSRDEVDGFWRRGVEAGYRSDGEPGPRSRYTRDYYGGFLLDPDGNSVEAVHRPGRTESGPPIDHLWLGVAELEASRSFYETVAPVLGLEVADARWPGHVAVAGRRRHMMLVADGRPPTENLHLAFPVPDNETVAEFHRVATAAGYRDNGPPGERPQKKGHGDRFETFAQRGGRTQRQEPVPVAKFAFGGFVLDPDGNNIEAVDHSR